MFLIPTRYILEKPIDNISKTILGGVWRNRTTFVISKWANQISSLPLVPVSNSNSSYLALFTAKPRPQLPPLDGDCYGPVLTI